MIKGHDQVSIVFQHDELNGSEVYSVKRSVKVTEEGSSEHFFDNVSMTVMGGTLEATQEQADGEETQELEQVILEDLWNTTGAVEDMTQVQQLGFEVDDDNELAEENIPTTEDQEEHGQQWGWMGVCHRQLQGYPNSCASIPGFTADTLQLVMPLMMFFIFFSYIEEVVLVETNKHIKGEELKLGEFLKWLGFWFYMATVKGFPRADFFCHEPVDPFKTVPFRLIGFFSANRFDDILSSLQLTNRARPTYRDPFWEVCQLVETFNNHVKDSFKPSWVNPDESVSIWFNKWACPGWVFCPPRIPHPWGNEYHTICCASSRIILSAVQKEFRRRLAKALVMNQYIEKEEQEAQRSKRRKT